MKRLFLLLIFTPLPGFAVPVVPNFQSGNLVSHTETTTKITEVINSVEYQSGWTYTVTGTNIKTEADSLVPLSETTANTINGVSSSWTSLDANTIPKFAVKNKDQPWQFTISISQPGLVNQTIVERTTEVSSMTDSVSTFSQ